MANSRKSPWGNMAQKLPKRLYHKKKKQVEKEKSLLIDIPRFAETGLDKRAGQRNYHMARSGAYADPRKKVPIDISKKLLLKLAEIGKTSGMGTMFHDGLSLHSLIHIAIKRKLGVVSMPIQQMVARYPYYKDVSRGRWPKPPYPEIHKYMKEHIKKHKSRKETR